MLTPATTGAAQCGGRAVRRGRDGGAGGDRAALRGEDLGGGQRGGGRLLGGRGQELPQHQLQPHHPA